MTEPNMNALKVDPEFLADYQIRIRNCNSIDQATISLRRSSLNIKYGPNGLGKSTIARALTLRTEGEESLNALTPFKYRSIADGPRPVVEGAEEINSVLTFNDAYVTQFVFQPDEVLKNSFEIFINTDDYKQGLEKIESMFVSLKETFALQTEFNEALLSFTELRDAFNLTKTGVVAKTSRGLKALGVGGKLKNIPAPLQGYKSFLQSSDPAGWITWQSKGKAFLDLSENCPFCSVQSVDKVTATQVSAEYESAAVKNMSVLRNALDKLGRYFEPGYLIQLEALTMSITEITPEEGLFLATLRGQVETLLQKFSAVQGLSFHALRDVKDVSAVLNDLKVDLSLLHAVNSDATKSVVELINAKLDEVAIQIIDVRKGISEQKRRVAGLIQVNQASINDFLSSAGYRYKVRIEPAGDSYRMLLEHEDASGHLDSASSHLSYGEKNAFALVLFMHHVNREQPDLVVLDDPISSFDKTKKFAILHQLFHGKNSLRNLTSLLLTHDIEPAIDIVLTGTSRQFTVADPAVHFLSGRSGLVTEKPIAATDINTFSQICDSNISSASDDAIKCIYLRRRFEVHGSRGVGYDLLSSLFHLREVPTKMTEARAQTPLTDTDIRTATEAVQKHIPSFDYTRVLSELKDGDALKAKFDATDVGYEKVQLFRIMSELNPIALKGDKVFTKFVNETYHIENEYVMQLNPRDFDAVPEYIVAACTALVEGSVAAEGKSDVEAVA
ncbi:ATP-binding protein [Arthrobacter sp. zg-Y179]|uniref:ATP-binding protein n=1 Tax=Arthrobacter sp. zg-Y179 TaxID=2894188 RepID=UPI001E374223|nr:ATP-binding protein [Arthrobacter sp. zg-Y179]MCC9174860.1 AAA family ATPase [Arthrobacter sp. zg-Y179]